MQCCIIPHIRRVDFGSSTDQHIYNIQMSFLTGPVHGTEPMIIARGQESEQHHCKYLVTSAAIHMESSIFRQKEEKCPKIFCLFTDRRIQL